jgi:hypothetical protein
MFSDIMLREYFYLTQQIEGTGCKITKYNILVGVEGSWAVFTTAY